MPDNEGDVENGPSLPDVVQSVGDRAEKACRTSSDEWDMIY